MRLSLDNLSLLITHYKKFLIHKRISDIVLVNSRLFLFYFKKETTQLLVDLDNNNPHIGLINSNYDSLSLPCDFIAKALSKGRPLITDIKLVNQDKIIKITTTATDAYYHNHQYYLYIELINAHANMVLTDENNKIITAFYETNINSPRLIIRNNLYTLPSKKNQDYSNGDFSFKEYKDNVTKSFNLSLDKRKKEIYGPRVKKYEKKIKSLERKINKIKESQKLAKEGNKYKEYGDTLLMHTNQIHKGDKEFNRIKLDPTLTVYQNANNYFNKYKKCKRTLETTTQILEQLTKELEDAQYYLEMLKCANEEESKLLIEQSKSNKTKTAPAYLPYYIKYKNVSYYYGHNAFENDYLTFKMFKRRSDVIWMHIKNYPSAHLIINKNNPNNEELDIASSLLLLINKLNSGEIMYTNREFITRGDALGKVNILKYKSINMHKINSLAAELIKREKRVHE